MSVHDLLSNILKMVNNFWATKDGDLKFLSNVLNSLIA